MVENDINKMFEIACEEMKQVKKASNEEKLKAYGLYKVATEGPYNIEKDKEIGFFDYEKKYKYDSWKKLSVLSSLEAKKEYINLSCDMLKKDRPDFGEKENNYDLFEGLFSKEDLDEINKNADFSDSGIHQFSSSAKNDLDEIKHYLENASNEECIFYEIQEKFRSSSEINSDFFQKYNHVDCKFNLTK